MKQIIFLPFSFFFFLSLHLSCLHAQRAETVLAVAPPTRSQPIQKLETLQSTVELEADLYLPIYRIPKNLHKLFMIRVMQTDQRQLTQKITLRNHNLYTAKSADHDGYDYYLPAAFNAKDIGEVFLGQLPAYLAQKAVLVKMEPNKLGCHCFGKF